MKDDLNAARGIMVGCLFALIFWTIVIGMAIASVPDKEPHEFRTPQGHRD